MKRIVIMVCMALVVSAQNATAAPPVVSPLSACAQSLHTPGRIATDAAANLYVTDPAAGRVVVYDAFGRVASTKAGFGKPLGIAVDSAGRIYVGEEVTGSVSVFDGGWNLLYQLGAGAGEFKLPNYIAPDPAGDRVFVSDGRANQIRVYTNGGAFAYAFGTQGTYSGEFDFPAGIVVSAAGEVFVVDQKNDRVQVFDRGGGYLRKFKLGSSGFNSAGRSQGAALDISNRLYVVETLRSFVRSFATNGGAALATNGGFGTGLGKLSLPVASCVDPFNRLFVSSVNNGRVELFGVDDYLHFSASPAASTIASGTSVEFSVTAGGVGPYTCQWRKGGADLVDGPGVSGSGTATLSLSGVTYADQGSYSVLVTGPSGSRTSPEAGLRVVMAPAIFVSPLSQIVPVGTNVILDVTAGGDNLVYHWRHNGVPLPTQVANSMYLENVQPRDSGTYEVTVHNVVGSAASDAALLTVMVPPAIWASPVSRNVAVGDTITLEVSVLGDALQYQWLYDGVPVPGANEGTLTLQNVQMADGGTYSVQVTNLVGAAVSDGAVLTVVVPPAEPVIDGVSVQPDGSLRISATAEAGYGFNVVASTNLVDWVVIATIFSDTGTIQFVDTPSTNYQQRFYQVVWRP